MTFPLLIGLPYLKVVQCMPWSVAPRVPATLDPKFRAGHRRDNGKSKLNALGSMSPFDKQMRYNGQSQDLPPIPIRDQHDLKQKLANTSGTLAGRS